MINPALYSSRSEEYGTPQSLFNELDAQFHFTLDPCASMENAKCVKFYTKEDDGLAQSWANERVFMNSPYGRDIKKWMEKAARSWNEEGALVVALVHARTDTRWWHDRVEPYATDISFIKGRLRFEGTKSSSPFPSVLIFYIPANEENDWPHGWVPA